MANHSAATHHAHVRERIHTKKEKYPHPDKLKRAIDHLIYFIVFLAPIMNLPQLIKIWVNQEAAGVSLLSWGSFTVFSIVWIVYGILHKEKPIIFMNAMLFVTQLFVAIGTYIYG